MTIDEAIAHAEWCAENSCGECAEEHRQLAEWLKRLQALRAAVSGLERMRDQLKDENARLRKLLQGAVNEMLDDCGDCWGGLCEDCECWVAEWEEELKKLGIEV